MARVTAIGLAVAAALFGVGCGGGRSDRSAEIGAEIHGTCSATTYAIVSKIDNSKAWIYDCDVAAKRMCVTEENGIASDQTATVKLLFQNSLSGGKPGCAKGPAF